MKKTVLCNRAYIDGQNLYIGTQQATVPWKVDLVRFRKYLRSKYEVAHAYYFIGSYKKEHDLLYTSIKNAGFQLVFRAHHAHLAGKKKGNVDTDIVFRIMKDLLKKKDTGKIVLVSGDGDYKELVDFLISENRFVKILFPNTKYASSLYKSIGGKNFSHLDQEDIRRKIAQKEKGTLGN